MRQSLFYTLIGETFIDIAFNTAKSVDPVPILAINDYNMSVFKPFDIPSTSNLLLVKDLVPNPPLWSTLSPEAQEAERQALRAKAQEFQKGCWMHFRASIRRLKQSHDVLPKDRQGLFDHYIDTLTSTTA